MKGFKLEAVVWREKKKKKETRKKLLSVRENREIPVFLKLLRKKKVVL